LSSGPRVAAVQVRARIVVVSAAVEGTPRAIADALGAAVSRHRNGGIG